MKISNAGIQLIKKYEGCRLTAYKCPAGVLTIGYGHTEGVKAGQKITQAQADNLLVSDMPKYEAKVNKYAKYGFNQNEFDALVSFAYNIGSIDQLTANGTRTKAQIAEKIPAYNKAGGRVLSGLVKRRADEKALFLKAVASTPVQTPAKPQTPQAQTAEFTVGRYILSSKMKVRKGPGTNYAQKTKKELSKGAQKVCDGNGCLPVGTKVDVSKIVIVGVDVWGLIPSGYIALKYGGKTYAKRP